MKLEHGTYEEHKATAQRAKDNDVTSVWTGDVSRNVYLQENLSFIKEENLADVELKVNYEEQASYYILTWK